MNTLSARLLKFLLTAKVIGVVLAVAALLIFVDGITSSLRDTDPASYYLIGILAWLVGWRGGQSHSKPIQVAAGIVAGGVAGIWVIGASLFSPILRLLQNSFALLPAVYATVRFQAPIDFTTVREPWLVIMVSSSALALRFQTWWLGLHNNVSVNDALIRNLIWLLATWCVAAWIGWFTARRNALLALTPALFLLANVLAYSERQTETLWFLAIMLMLLMGVWNHAQRTSQWDEKQVDYAESISYDSTTVILVLVFSVGTLAYITPSISWREVRQYIRERAAGNNEVADALGVQAGSQPPQVYSVQIPTLPREHLLRGGVANSDRIVMTIRTGELSPRADSALAASAPRYYWRSVIYDRYTSKGWETSNSIEQTVQANSPLIPGLLKHHRPIRLNIQTDGPIGNLFWTGFLFSADIPLELQWRIKPTSNLLANQSALLQADIFAAATNSQAYSVQAYVPDVSLDELRTALSAYPVEIQDRYLNLPSSIPERVLTLAKQITAESVTPYEQARAIESYLRTTYPYDLNVPAPPPGRDVVDFFLFDLKKGYCDYYASAMVVLARANGLPARFVSGYAPGEYDAPNAQYIIRELHAHSWVEVYFPEIGWIEFEPTGSLPEITHAPAQLTAPITDTTNTPPRQADRFNTLNVEVLLSIPFLCGVLSIFYFAWYEKWTYTRQTPNIAIARLYQQLYRVARPLVGKRARGETALEFSTKLMQTLHAFPRFEKMTRRLQIEIHALTEYHHAVLFREASLTHYDVQQAWASWSRVRWRLWIVKLFHTQDRSQP